MAKYNLVRNGYFKSLTSSGTGNVDLSIIQLEKLMDGNLISDGVSVTSSGILFMEIDLSNRIKVDGIRIYANDLSKSSNIKFYYKNYSVDSYSLLTTSSGSYYYTAIPSPSAPRFILTTVSGVDITLYEFEVFNDDYIVAYGEDGSMSSTDLPNTQLGYESDPHPVAIYNNSTDAIPADAYTCVDYTGTDADRYLEISASENGPYVKLEDGALIEDDNLASKYFWSMGKLDDSLSINDNNVVIEIDLIHFSALPMGNSANSLNVGFNAMDYDRVNKNVYMICMDGGTTGPVRLLEYLYESDTWRYIGDINPSIQSSNNFPTMAYCDVSGSRRVYVMTTRAGGFGYYDLDGSLNNWTACANPSWGGSLGANDMVSMCSDGVRYVYALSSIYNAHDTNRDFKRFDTVSGTWSALSDQYLMYYYTAGGGSGFPNVTSLTYDYDRNYIYLHNASEGHSDLGDYIQRYIVDLDVWNNQWFRVDAHTGTVACSYAISYNNDYIYLGPANSFSNYFYRLNLDSLLIESIYLGYSHTNITQGSYGLPILAIDSLVNSLFESSLFLSGIINYMGYLLAYNAVNVDVVGTYTSPIFQLDDKTQSSYFVIDGTAVSGSDNISHDPDVYNGTIRFRSSDEDPIVINEVYILGRTGASEPFVRRWDVYPDNVTDATYGISYTSYSSFEQYSVAVDRRTGVMAFSYRYQSGSLTHQYSLQLIDSRKILPSYIINDTSATYRTYFIQFDRSSGVWIYTTAFRLRHYSYTLSLLADVYEGIDFMYDMAAELDGNGVWYTNKVENLVVHRDTSGTLLQTIILTLPRAICGTQDNGCWVADDSEGLIRRYSFSAQLMSTINYPEGVLIISRMTDDMSDGFWFIGNTHFIYHITANGECDVNGVYVLSPDTIRSTLDGCVVYNDESTQRKVSFIGRSSKAVDKSISNIVSVGAIGIGVFSLDISKALEYNLTMSGDPTPSYIPASYDPVWGSTSGNLEWKEVRKDGYYLPKCKYHQVEVTLRGNATLEKIIMAPAIRTQDIQSKQYKNIYVRADISYTADVYVYEARLKTWWGVSD